MQVLALLKLLSLMGSNVLLVNFLHFSVFKRWVAQSVLKDKDLVWYKENVLIISISKLYIRQVLQPKLKIISEILLKPIHCIKKLANVQLIILILMVKTVYPVLFQTISISKATIAKFVQLNLDLTQLRNNVWSFQLNKWTIIWQRWAIMLVKYLILILN